MLNIRMIKRKFEHGSHRAGNTKNISTSTLNVGVLYALRLINKYL